MMSGARKVAIAVLMCLYVPQQMVEAVSPVADVENTSTVAKPRIERLRRVNQDGSPKAVALVSRLSDIDQAFGVPLCFEWPYVEADRTPTPQPEAVLTLRLGQPLTSALDELMATSGGRLKWQRVGGSICVVATPQPGDMVENNLDVRVSLKVEGVSTWEALKALGRAVNRNPVKGRRLTIGLDFLRRGSAPPKGFAEDNSISLDLDNVTAREAACAIIAASPLQIAYTYWNYYRPQLSPDSTPSSVLSLSLWREKEEGRVGRLSRQELLSWMAEEKAVYEK